MVAVACCGAGRGGQSPLISQVSTASGYGAVTLVDAPKPLVAIDVESLCSTDAAAALSACDVVFLEVRFYDLVESTPHGLAQLLPLLRASALSDKSKRKLVVLSVADFDSSAVTQAEVHSFATRQLDAMMANMVSAKETTTSSALMQLECLFLPARSSANYERSFDDLQASLTDSSSRKYILRDHSSSISELISSVDSSATIRASDASVSPAEVHTAYQCGLLAEAAARDFQKGASALRKASDTSLLADFGEQCNTLVITIFFPCHL